MTDVPPVQCQTWCHLRQSGLSWADIRSVCRRRPSSNCCAVIKASLSRLDTVTDTIRASVKDGSDAEHPRLQVQPQSQKAPFERANGCLEILPIEQDVN